MALNNLDTMKKSLAGDTRCIHLWHPACRIPVLNWNFPAGVVENK